MAVFGILKDKINVIGELWNRNAGRNVKRVFSSSHTLLTEEVTMKERETCRHSVGDQGSPQVSQDLVHSSPQHTPATSLFASAVTDVPRKSP